MNCITVGSFYFIADDYFVDFQDPFLLQNKEIINGKRHGRPCFYALEDPNTGLIWMIPISSQTNKYHKIELHKMLKYGRCDTIIFGSVLGQERAFLIQNMFPVNAKYIDSPYVDMRNNVVVKVDGAFELKLIKAALRVLDKVRRGGKLIFPNVLLIEKQLLQE